MITTLACLSVGHEVLDGRVQDTNAPRVGALCRSRGLTLREIRTVPDELDAIATAIRDLARIADLVVISGGCGPTTDDLTREAMARAAGVPLVEDPGTVARLEAFFAGRGWPMPANNLRQAAFPAGARILQSEVGTADACLLTLDGTPVVSLPGVPREFEALLAQWVVPMLPEVPARARRSWCLMGAGESAVGAAVEGLGLPPALAVSYRASWPTVHVELSTDADGEQRLLEEAGARVDDALAPWRIGGSDPADALIRGLTAQGMRVALAESCTGGLLAAALIERPGASAWVERGWVTYANAAKVEALGVPWQLIETAGAVSGEVAAAMADGALARSMADMALSVTGIAGPEGGSADKPVGTVWFGLAFRDRVWTLRARLGRRSREAVRRGSAALAMAWGALALEGRPEALRSWSMVEDLRDQPRREPMS
jgi:nicotinamide-nucleotide amidase